MKLPNELVGIQTEQLAEMDTNLAIIAEHHQAISMRVRGLVASRLLEYANAPSHLKDNTIVRGQYIDETLRKVIQEYIN